MTKNLDKNKQRESIKGSISDEDLKHIVDSYVSEHPDSLASEQIDTLKKVVHDLEQLYSYADEEQNSTSQESGKLTEIAKTLGGAGALALAASIIAPQIPIFTIGASVIGAIASNLLANLVDKSKE